MEQKNHRLLQCALEILNFVAARSEPVSFKEIYQSSELPKSTVHNLVQTLVNMNYLHKNESANKFTVGLRCFEVGNAYLLSNPFYAMAKEIIEATSMRCNETTHFAILNGADVVYLYKFDSTQPIRVFSHIGKRVPAHATAIGKALLSGFDDQKIRRMYPCGELPAMTPNTITSVEVLLGQLHEIRRTSIAYETEESSPYVKCVAVPILNRQGLPVAGISISIPIYREACDEKKLAALLLEAKGQLEALLSPYD